MARPFDICIRGAGIVGRTLALPSVGMAEPLARLTYVRTAGSHDNVNETVLALSAARAERSITAEPVPFMALPATLIETVG